MAQISRFSSLFSSKKSLMSLLRRSKSTIQEALDVTNVGQSLQVHGWVKAARKQKANTFIDIDDGLVSGGKKLQLVIASHQVPESLNFHSFVKASGILKISQHRGQEVELEVESLELVTPVKDKYPFQPRKKYDDDLPRSYPQYRAKQNDFASLLRIRSSLSKSIHDFFHEQNFVQIHTPILTANDCEGAGELFQVVPANDSISKKMKKPDVESLDQAYFDKKVFLTVSGQLHLEAMCNGLEQVYTFSPAFRAEMGRTRRHLCEFSMIEAEKIIFDQDLDQLLKLQESLIKLSLAKTLDSHEGDVVNFLKLNSLKHKSKQVGNDDKSLEHVEKVLKEPFIVMTYAEAFDILEANRQKFEVQPQFSHGLGKEHELFLVQHCHHVPVFVINWPKKTKAFYARQCSDNAGLVSAVDLLFPSVGELAGGSLREDKHEILQKNLEGLKGLDWYLDLRCNGAAPMGGFGLGFERLIQFLLKVYDIRDTVPFSRRPHECRL